MTKLSTRALLLLASLAGPAPCALADAPTTDCLIYVHAGSETCTGAAASSADLAAKEKNNTWFTDHDQPANLVAARCIERAEEFMHWCGGDYAFATYRVQGHNVISAAANGSGAWLSDGIGRWTAFHK